MMGTQDSVLAGEEGIVQCHQVVTVHLGRGQNTELKGQVGGWALLCLTHTLGKGAGHLCVPLERWERSWVTSYVRLCRGRNPGPIDLIPGALPGSASP